MSESGFWQIRLLSSYWFYAVLLLVLVVVFSLVQTSETYLIEQGPPLTTDSPRLVMHKVNATQFTPDGKVELTINADGLAQFVDNRLSLSNPLVVLFKDNQPKTYMRGQRGDVRGAHFRFSGLVHVSTSEQTELLSGDTLDYYHDKNQLEVINPRITIRTESAVSHTNAALLKADGETSNLWLHNGVVTHVTELTP